jgi:hypothetical protein
MIEITEDEMDLKFSLVEELIAGAGRKRTDPEFNECLIATTRVMEELKRAFAAGASYVVFPAEDMETAMHMLSFFRRWIDKFVVTSKTPDGQELRSECVHAVDFFFDVLAGMHGAAHWCEGTA